MKYIISSECVFFEKNGHFVIDNFILHKQRVLNIKYIPLLTLFAKPTSISSATNDAINFDISSEEINEVIEQLLDFHVLEQYKNNSAGTKSTIDSLPMSVRYFYYNAKTDQDSYYEGSVDELISLSEKKASKPDTFKEYSKNEQITLPIPNEEGSELLSSMLDRRSIRNTDPTKKITLAEISELLYFSLGMTGQTFDSPMGNVVFKTVPTPGGRGSIEAYIVNVNKNTEIPIGIFHYNVKRNSLELISSKDVSGIIMQLTGGQLHVQSSSLFVLFTSRIDRMVWKYQEATALTSPFVELGAIIQNQYLIANKLGIGACFIGAKRDSIFEKLLHVDNKVENCLGLMSLGKIDNYEYKPLANSRFYRPDLETLRKDYENEQK